MAQQSLTRLSQQRESRYKNKSYERQRRWCSAASCWGTVHERGSRGRALRSHRSPSPSGTAKGRDKGAGPTWHKHARGELNCRETCSWAPSEMHRAKHERLPSSPTVSRGTRNFTTKWLCSPAQTPSLVIRLSGGMLYFCAMCVEADSSLSLCPV